MPKRKENPRCNVVSMRVSDEERTVLEEITRRTHKSMSHLLREALQLYVPENRVSQG